MNRPEPRYRHSRPAAEDRGFLLDRIFGWNEENPIFQRVIVGMAIALISVVVYYQAGLAIARASHAVTP